MSRAMVIHKLWELVRYSPISRNCSNCAHTCNDDWDDGSNECNVISGVKFPISMFGICKLHSFFNHGNIKYNL